MAGRIDRRTFIRAAGGGALLAAQPFAFRAAASARLTRRRRVPRADDVRFRQGVASGEPTPHGITLWTRVDGLEQSSRLELEVARDHRFRQVVERREVVAKRRDNFTVCERIGRLKPNERYFYRFSTRRRDSEVGRFKTALPPDSRQPVRIGFFSCQDWEPGFYTAHAGLAEEEDLDLVVCLGDYIYEQHFYDPVVRPDPTGKNRDGDVQTRAEYREKYALYHSDENLRRVRARHPLLALYDDHEVEENWANNAPGDGGTVERRVPFGRRRRNGLRTFFEHMPMARSNRRRVYGRFRYGRQVELVMLNERLFRNTVYPTGTFSCPEETTGDPFDPRARSGARGAGAAPVPTMLGSDQKDWLKRTLRRSAATWKAIANPLMIMGLELPMGQPLVDDQWDGFPEERREICTYIRDEGIVNVAFFTGDIHNFFSGDLTPSGTQRPGSAEQPVATEFVCGSITSLGTVDCFGFTGAEDIASLLGDQVLLDANDPHLRYSNVERRGYGVMEARDDELIVDFRAPESTTVPESPVFTLQRMRVAAGMPRVELDG